MTIQTFLDEEALRPPAGNARRFGGRWRLVSAGLSNVWRYGDLVLPAESGRLLLRGQNGTGKTTALEALWPFLLDLDKTKLRAGQSRSTTLTSLMREGHGDRKRIGYAWLTFAGPEGEGTHSYGARLVFSNGSTPSVKVEPFTIPGEPVKDMPLTGPGRVAITTGDAFRDAVEAAGGTVFKDEHEYVTTIGNRVFAASRSDLVALADRIRKVRNPSLLAATSADQAGQALREALPGVANDVVEAAGTALAATEETRAAFRRDTDAAATLAGFAEVWAGHAADVAERVASHAADARAAHDKARREHARREAIHTQAVKATEGAQEDLEKAELDEEAATSEIDAIKKSPAYATIGRLADLRATAAAKEGEAAAKTGSLERLVAGVRRDSGALTEDASDLAKDVAATCASAVGADPHAAQTTPTVTVTTRPQPILTVGDHGYDPGAGVDVAAHPDQLRAAALSWTALAKSHEDHAASAKLMSREHRTVAAAEQDAARKATIADQDQAAADKAAQQRDRCSEAANAQTARLAEAITKWAAKSLDLTATPDSDALDNDAIADAVANGPASLLDAALEWQVTARGNAATIVALHTTAEGEHTNRARDLHDQARGIRAQAEELRAGRILPPPRPRWAGPASQDAFANAIGWAEGPDHTTRALVESSLASAGLLGASITVVGVDGGTWAVTTTAPPVSPNLTTLIHADPTHPLAHIAQQILERVALADTASNAPTDAVAAVGTDGTFRLGVITGRAPGADDPAVAPVPSHIGAAQRRAAALAEAARLDSEADAFDEEAATWGSEAARLRAEVEQVKARSAAFPSTGDLATAERTRADAASTSTHARERADQSAQDAQGAQDRARSIADEWRANVTAVGLPADIDALAVVQETAADTARALHSAVGTMTGHQSALARLKNRVRALADDAAALTALHAAAQTAHRQARRARQEYELLEAEQGRDAADLSARLSDAERRATAGRELVATGRVLLDEAKTSQTRAEVDTVHAADDVAAKEPAAIAALADLRGLVAVPDVADAVLSGADAARGADLIGQVQSAVAGVTTWGKRKVAESYETTRAQLAGVWAVDRTDGYGDHLDTYQCTYDGTVLTPGAAARLAHDLAARAADRLHEAEESALRDFIVGQLPRAIGVAWQDQKDWVDNVNLKMESASASSGVGVRVRKTLRDDLSPPQKTVHRLACGKSAATRDADEDRELADALKSLLDSSDGETFTDRVRQAVEVRDWIHVDYLVHRPGQEPRRWTRNTGLSGGERRLVILAPMLASIAALYDTLPPSTLRLAALDEVPAEVDERGREGLARYVAELDLDVICTSYLWDGAPGAWDGVDAHDLEAGPDGVVVAFPMLVRGLEPLPGDPEATW